MGEILGSSYLMEMSPDRIKMLAKVEGKESASVFLSRERT
jgi:hypothetical protein